MLTDHWIVTEEEQVSRAVSQPAQHKASLFWPRTKAQAVCRGAVCTERHHVCVLQALKLQHPEGQLNVLLRLNLQHGSIEAELVQESQACK